MPSLEAIVLMGPPGAGKSFLGNHLNRLGIATYVELEPILVAKFGTGSTFAENKANAVAFIRQCWEDQFANWSGVFALESTGITDRPLLEDIQLRHSVALIKLVTPKSTCSRRIASRAPQRNISNEIAAGERLHDYWCDEIEPTYCFQLEVDGEDVAEASRAIGRFIQGTP